MKSVNNRQGANQARDAAKSSKVKEAMDATDQCAADETEMQSVQASSTSLSDTLSDNESG